MDTRLTADDKNEILRYLGYRGSEITDGVEKRIEACMNKANEVSKIGYSYRLFSVSYEESGVVVQNALMTMPGSSIKKHLAGAETVAFMCVTLGRAFDVEVEAQMVKDPASGVILNACGIALIEKAADELQRLIDESLEGNLHTGVRFSPGYGDLPLSLQEDFLRILNAEKYAGIRLNSSYLCNPSKTVTAVCAIID